MKDGAIDSRLSAPPSSMKNRLRLAGLLLGVPGMAFAQIPAACACSCAVMTPEEQFASADAVFVGTIVQKVDHADPGEHGGPGGEAEWVFDVESISKGEVADPVSVWTGAAAMCGYSFSKGSRYEVYAHSSENGRWTTSICTGTKLLEAGPGPRTTPSAPTPQSPREPTPEEPQPPSPSPADATPITPTITSEAPTESSPSPATLTLASQRTESSERGRWMLLIFATASLTGLGAGVWWRKIRRG